MSDMETVFALLEKPRDEWSKEQLTAALFTVLEQHREAITGWGQALEHCDAYQATIERLLNDNAALRQATTVAEKIEPAKPKRVGRPKKHTDMQIFLDWETEAREKYGNLPDAKLINAYFADVFKSHGKRAGRVNSPEFKSQAETIRKLLIEARNKAKR